MSIIITHWNRVDRLLELLKYFQRILDAPKPYIISEIIVVDSRSEASSGLRSKLSEINQQSCFPIYAIYLDQNKGPSYARARGLRQAKGDYIQFLDDDDWIHPAKLAFQLGWAAEHQNPDVIASPWARADASAEIGHACVCEMHSPDFSEPKELAVLETFTPLMACLLKRSALVSADAFNEGFWLVEDVHLQLKLIQRGASFAIAPSAGPLFFYRSSPPSGSLSTAIDRAPFLEACLRNLQLAERILDPIERPCCTERIRLARLYAQLARGLFAIDRPAFDAITAHMQQLDPAFLPPGPPMLRAASRLLGYPAAEQLSHWVRVLKRRLLGRC